jgi:acyl dehydratase
MMVDVDALVRDLKGRIGFEGAPFTHTVEKGALIKFAKAVGETNPIYLDEAYARTTRFGGLIACPTWVSVYPPEVNSRVIVRDLPLKRFLHTDDVARMHGVIRPGDEITATPRYGDVYTRTGKAGPMLFQAADIALTNQRQELVAEVRVVSVNFA